MILIYSNKTKNSPEALFTSNKKREKEREQTYGSLNKYLSHVYTHV